MHTHAHACTRMHTHAHACIRIYNACPHAHTRTRTSVQVKGRDAATCMQLYIPPPLTKSGEVQVGHWSACCSNQCNMYKGRQFNFYYMHACAQVAWFSLHLHLPMHGMWWSLSLHIHPTCETQYKGKTVVCGSSILCLDDRSHSFHLQECGKAVNGSVYEKGERVHSCLLTVYSNEDMLCRKFYS